MAELGPITALRDAREASEPELWLRAPRDEAREAAWLAELSAQGVPVAPSLEEGTRGVAASVEPSTGDPQLLAVLPDGEAEFFTVDRRFMRVQHWPRTSLAREDDIVRAADLADRAQLALGEPVLVRYGQHEGRCVVEAVRGLAPRLSFTNASYRKLSPLASGNGTLAPLSVDAIDRALRLERDFGDEPRVSRIFARAYRRIDEHHTPWSATRGLRELGQHLRLSRPDSVELVRVLSDVGRLGRDILLSVTDARRFRVSLAAAIAQHDAVELTALDRVDLIDALRARMALVTSALVLLERARLATLTLVPPLEALCGSVSRDELEALAEPERTSERQAIDARLVELAKRCLAAQGGEGALVLPPTYDAALLHEWERLKRTLKHVRLLGMDVRPDAMGADDSSLAQAVDEAFAHARERSEARRSGAERSLRERAQKGRFGVLAVPPTMALIALVHRLAQAKGAVAEGLSAALLRLRVAALEAGRRLAQEGVLERAEDALYMPLDEIEQALEGELGAYAARVRLRREDDRRWRNYRAPRIVVGRRA